MRNSRRHATGSAMTSAEFSCTKSLGLKPPWEPDGQKNFVRIVKREPRRRLQGGTSAEIFMGVPAALAFWLADPCRAAGGLLALSENRPLEGRRWASGAPDFPAVQPQPRFWRSAKIFWRVRPSSPKIFAAAFLRGRVRPARRPGALTRTPRSENASPHLNFSVTKWRMPPRFTEVL